MLRLTLTTLPTGLYRLAEVDPVTKQETHLQTFGLSEAPNPSAIQLAVEVGKVLRGLNILSEVDLEIVRGISHV